MLIDPAVCVFCYRSCEEGRGETESQAELVVELVPQETCSIAYNAQWSGYIDALVMYGAQHEYILDDRDVDEYNMDRKFEQFAHLKQEIQKLIIYSILQWRQCYIQIEQICGQLLPGHRGT